MKYCCFTQNRLLKIAVAGIFLCAVDLYARVNTSAQDTLYRKSPLLTEVGNAVRVKMTSSAFPVQIKIQGRAVCVRSNYNQVLPVYSENGTFYSMFRLSKGINWINGLPRGTYYINNRKITIS